LPIKFLLSKIEWIDALPGKQPGYCFE
jgi:hypothetical protein